MIIEIRPDGRGLWTLIAKQHADAWPPDHLAYGRNRVQIEFLVRGILADHEASQGHTDTATNPSDQAGGA